MDSKPSFTYDNKPKHNRSHISGQIVVGNKKYCTLCSEFKSLRLFNRNSQSRSGYRSECRNCYNTKTLNSSRLKIQKKYKVKQVSPANYAQCIIDGNKKYCKRCFLLLSVTSFTLDTTTKTGYANRCIYCIRKN